MKQNIKILQSICPYEVISGNDKLLFKAESTYQEHGVSSQVDVFLNGEHIYVFNTKGELLYAEDAYDDKEVAKGIFNILSIKAKEQKKIHKTGSKAHLLKKFLKNKDEYIGYGTNDMN